MRLVTSARVIAASARRLLDLAFVRSLIVLRAVGWLLREVAKWQTLIGACVAAFMVVKTLNTNSHNAIEAEHRGQCRDSRALRSALFAEAFTLQTYVTRAVEEINRAIKASDAAKFILPRAMQVYQANLPRLYFLDINQVTAVVRFHDAETEFHQLLPSRAYTTPDSFLFPDQASEKEFLPVLETLRESSEEALWMLNNSLDGCGVLFRGRAFNVSPATRN